MIRAASWVLGIFLLLYGCSGPNATKGPYVPLVSRLDAESNLVVFVDLASLSKSLDDFRTMAANLPLVESHPEIKTLLDQQWAVLDSSLAMAKGMLGVDILKDFKRMVIGVQLKKNGGDVVAVLDGKIPPGIFHRVIPGAKPEKKFGEDIWTIPESGFHVAVVNGKTLVICSGDMSERRLKGDKVSKRLLEHHPELFRDGVTGSYVRMSFFMPPWLVLGAKKLMEQKPGLKMVESLLSVRQVYVDVAEQLEVSIVCGDEQGAEHVKSILDAEAEMMMGGQHMVRAVAYMLMAMDLEFLDDLPPAFIEALADRKAQEQTLDFLFPEPREAPKVEMDGKNVSLKSRLGMLKGSFTLVGLMASVAVPAFIKYQREVRLAEEEMGSINKMSQDSDLRLNPDGTIQQDKGSAVRKGARQ